MVFHPLEEVGSVVQRRCGPEQEPCLERHCGSLGGASLPGGFGFSGPANGQRQEFDAFVEFGDHEVDVLLKGVAVDFCGLEAGVGPLVTPDEDGAVLAEKAVVVEYAQESGFRFHILPHGRAVLLVHIHPFHEGGALLDRYIELVPVIEIGLAGGSGAGVVAGAVELVVNPLVPGVTGFVGTSDHPAVATNNFSVERKITVAVRKELVCSGAVAENLLHGRLVGEIGIEIAVTGAYGRNCKYY